jgi:hypothetical protein
MNEVWNPELFKRAAPVAPPQVEIINDIIVEMTYTSVYDVHVAPDTITYPNIRAQPGGFDKFTILHHLKEYICPDEYDFIMLYTLHEVPGWINSGHRARIAAKNIGLWNPDYGSLLPPTPFEYSKLRNMPHMNSLEFMNSYYGEPLGVLVALHEMGHHWGVYITYDNPTVFDYSPGVPAAHVTTCCGHWVAYFEEAWDYSTNYFGQGMPGLLSSGPADDYFNVWDLYFMGLMDYNECKPYSYDVFEYPHTDPPAPQQILRHCLCWFEARTKSLPIR